MLKALALASIRLYRRGISPFLPATCRFHPTCSAYAQEAIREHGLARGGWFAARRLGRCRPFGPSGYDPVPPRAAVRPVGHIAGPRISAPEST